MREKKVSRELRRLPSRCRCAAVWVILYGPKIKLQLVSNDYPLILSCPLINVSQVISLAFYVQHFQNKKVWIKILLFSSSTCIYTYVSENYFFWFTIFYYVCNFYTGILQMDVIQFHIYVLSLLCMFTCTSTISNF